MLPQAPQFSVNVFVNSRFITYTCFHPIMINIHDESTLRIGEKNNRRGLSGTPFYEGSVSAMNVAFLNLRKVII
jgi:hypothetical protein